jgi:hypothetical protein
VGAKSVRLSVFRFYRATKVNLRRTAMELQTNLPSMILTSYLLIASGLIFKKKTWDELSLYWQQVDEGFDNEAQQRKVGFYGKASFMAWGIAVAFLWVYTLLSTGIQWLTIFIGQENFLLFIIPAIILAVLKTFAGIVIFLSGMVICCVIGILLNVLLALIRSKFNFYVASAVGLGNMILLFLTHYTTPIFQSQSNLLPDAMKHDYNAVITSAEFMISAVISLFSIIGIGSIHNQFLKTDGMFRLFRLGLKEENEVAP